MIYTRSLQAVVSQLTFSSCARYESTSIHNLIPKETTEEDENKSEEIINCKRDKSRLQKKHFHLLNKIPYTLNEEDSLATQVREQRILYGRFGSASKIDPALLWPTKEELNYSQAWEAAKYPYSFHEMVQIEHEKAKQMKMANAERQATIAAKIEKLDEWKSAVRAKKSQAEAAAFKEQAKREQMIEEIRQMFGFNIDPKDERFQQALEEKEKEQKKAAKEAKKLAKQRKLLEELEKSAEEAKKLSARLVKKDELHGQPIIEKKS